jgi:CubicO group peptidase (beta-lactamase class C family)/pimeloyl-ACP methyl ester carboxylesterase
VRRIALVLLIIPLFARPLQAQNETEARIRRVENGLMPPVQVKGDAAWNIRERMEHYKVPGVSVAVIENFRVVWAKGYGVQDLETKEPVTERTIFQAASIGKSLNATAILRKVREGKLSLDENVNSYLRSWKLPDNEFTAGKKVTIANLLSHTGGTTVSGFPGYEVGAPIPTVEQILRGEPPANTAPIIVDTEPGVAFRYSGGGTTILQLMLSELEKKPYPQIMKETVLDPLGMTVSSFNQPLPLELQPLAATAHDRNGQPVDGRYYVYPELAAAGLWTTPTDLARFAIEHQLSLQGKSNKILSRELEERMTTPYIGEGYGLGFQIQKMGDEVYFLHGGGNRGYRSLLIAHKQKGYGAVVMTNGASEAMIPEIIRSIAKEYSWGGYLNAPYELYAISPDRLQRCAGRYRLDVDQVASVTVDNDHLNVDVTGEPPIELYPISENEFIRRDRDSKVLFIIGAEPDRDTIRITGGGPAITLTRMRDDQKIPYEHLSSGNIDEAINQYRRIRSGNPSHPAVSESRINTMGYELMGKNRLKEAIAIFKLNTEFYPSSFNVFDSLGEAYLNSGDKELAIENYSKSLELNPANANATEALKKLRETALAVATEQSSQAPEAVEKLVDIGEYNLNFRIIAGKGAVILLESGGGMDSSEWEALAPLLSRETGATVVAYDRAGFGKSDLPETKYDLHEDTEALWRGLRQLGLDRDLILVGHSYGGFLIRFEAGEHPSSVKGLVFVDPFTFEFVDAMGAEAARNIMGKLPFDVSQPEKLTKYQRAEVRMMGAPGSNLAEKCDTARKAALPKGLPVRVITSGKEWLPPQVQKLWRQSHERLTTSIEGAKLIVAEQSDHMIPERQPDLVLSVVTEVVRLTK